MNRQNVIAACLIVVGVVLGAIALILDLNGGPWWLHLLTWLGGGSAGYGVVLFIRASHDRATRKS